MDVPVLRKLTKKSKLGFGKSALLTVGELIDLKSHKYLRWCYFNLSGISFVDELLEELRISPDFIIKKPGTNPELHEKLNSKLRGYMSSEMIIANTSKSKKNIKIYKAKVCSFSRGVQSKKSLQAKNQGH